VANNTLAQAIAAHDNDHATITGSFQARTGLDWHAPTPADLAAGIRLSVVIPTHNNAHSLRPVLDALAEQTTAASIEVIVIDDASTDTTPEITKAHPVVDHAVQLAVHAGGPAARNVGAHLATTDTLVHVDADMVLPNHVLADISARTRPDVVLVGFRHNVSHQLGDGNRPFIPAGEPDLEADHRVRWYAPAGVPMFYSGQVYDTAFVGRPLDDTRDFIELGNGRTYYDWDLPRMVVTALVAVPRVAFCDVGGLHPAFDEKGWGCDDTHLGAALIAQGCKVIPLRQARGWHLDPPDADAAWKAKFASLPPRVLRLRQLLTEPAPTARSVDLARRAEALLAEAVTLR
jgi:GT2 family glycosyltransferase